MIWLEKYQNVEERPEDDTVNFKDIVRQDVKNVFLNPNEFGEKHKVNGKEMTLIIDNNEMLEREKRYQKEKIEGLHRQQMLFYVAAVDFGRLPASGKVLDIDGQKYVITDAIKEGPMYSISVEVHNS